MSGSGIIRGMDPTISELPEINSEIALLPPTARLANTADHTSRDNLARGWWESYEDDAPNTAERYRRDIALFFTWADTNGHDVFNMIPWHIQRYRAWLALPDRVTRYTRKTKLSDSTIAGRIAAVSSFYRYAQEQAGRRGFVPNPAEGVRRPKPSTESQTTGLTEDEVKAILGVAEKCGQREYALVLLLATVGLRVSEACQLDTGDLVRDQGEWMLWVKRKGHGDTRVLVACPEPTARALRRHMRGRRGAMFHGNDGERMTRRQAAHWIKAMTAQALGRTQDGGPRISPHSFRHTATTLALSQAGVSHADVAAQMGHTTTQTTARYDRANRRKNNAAAKALGALFDDGLPDVEEQA
jgi:integrase/recombinase XerD